LLASGQASSNPYQFTGRENDGTGLYSYRARYYNPSLQRFVAQDPKEFVNSTNLYDYVTDDPTDILDPTGERFLNCGEQLLKLIDMLDVYKTKHNQVYKTKHNQRMACPADCRDQGHKKRLGQLQNPLNQQIETVRRACKNEFEALTQLAALENEYKNLITLLECE